MTESFDTDQEHRMPISMEGSPLLFISDFIKRALKADISVMVDDNESCDYYLPNTNLIKGKIKIIMRGIGENLVTTFIPNVDAEVYLETYLSQNT